MERDFQEYDRLRAQVEARGCVMVNRERYEALQERYYWLAKTVLFPDYGDNDYKTTGWRVYEFLAPVAYGPSIDDAIDAARAAENARAISRANKVCPNCDDSGMTNYSGNPEPCDCPAGRKIALERNPASSPVGETSEPETVSTGESPRLSVNKPRSPNE